MLKPNPPTNDLTPLAEVFMLLAEIGRKQREAEARPRLEEGREQAFAQTELEPQIENKQTVLV